MIGYSKNSLPTHILDSGFIHEAENGRGSVGPGKSNNLPISVHEPRESAIPVFRNAVEEPVEKPFASNNPADLVAHARRELGNRYGLGRPLRRAELARLVGLSDRYGGEHVADLENGRDALSGPVEVVLRMLLAGEQSPRHAEALRSRYAAARRKRRKRDNPGTSGMSRPACNN